MISGEHTFTATSRTRKAELNVNCNWMKQAWDDILTELIQKSFGKCCITNAIDRTEDDEVWEQESEDPFEDVDDAGPIDDEQYYVDAYEEEKVGLDPAAYEIMFGSSVYSIIKQERLKFRDFSISFCDAQLTLEVFLFLEEGEIEAVFCLLLRPVRRCWMAWLSSLKQTRDSKNFSLHLDKAHACSQ